MHSDLLGCKEAAADAIVMPRCYGQQEMLIVAIKSLHGLFHCNTDKLS